MATITYDEFGVTYDDALYSFDGGPATVVPTETQQRPRYWIGRGSKDRPKVPDYISVTIHSGIASLNGEASEAESSTSKFAGETPEPTVQSRPTKIQSKDLYPELDVQSYLLEDSFLIDCSPIVKVGEENLVTARLVLEDDSFQQPQIEG